MQIFPTRRNICERKYKSESFFYRQSEVSLIEFEYLFSQNTFFYANQIDIDLMEKLELQRENNI